MDQQNWQRRLLRQQEQEPQKNGERPSSSAISPVKYVLKHLKRQRLRLALAIFWSILFVIIPMQIPILTGALIDSIHHAKHLKIYGLIEFPSSTPSEIITFVVIGLIIIAGLYGMTAYFRTISISRVSRHFVSEIRKTLVKKLEILSLDIHSHYGSGELLNRAIIDTQSLRPFIESSIIKTTVKISQMAYPLLMLFVLDPYLASIATCILPVQWIITRKLQKKLHKASRQTRTAQANLTTAIKENLDGIETIQTSNAEAVSIKKISLMAERVEVCQIQTQRYSGMITGIVWALTSLGLALVWWQGGLKVLSGQMSIGSLVTFTGLALFIYAPSRNFTKAINDYQKGIVAAERIQEILDTPSTIKEYEDATNIEICAGKIEFRNVSFRYRQYYSYYNYEEHLNKLQKQQQEHHQQQLEKILKCISFTIEPYSLTAIVGKSGSGKSSLLKLISRLYDPIEGHILIDGQDIQRVKLDSLRSQIAVVPQTPIIFSGTIAENIKISKPDATEEELIEACKLADCLEFITRQEKGFETRLGQGGASLSGGQIQRIAIARALIRKPKILLLDEPSSALDSQSESAIMSTLSRLKCSMTIILVGHHLKAISNADRLIVLNEGKIVQDGTHRELISSQGLYSMLYFEDT